MFLQDRTARFSARSSDILSFLDYTGVKDLVHKDKINEMAELNSTESEDVTVRGMYPIDIDAPRPEIPNQERIFAAAAELQKAYENNEEWTKDKPLFESMVLLTLTAVEEGLRVIMNKWAAGSRETPFPDMLESIDEIMRIVSKEGKEAYEATLQKDFIGPKLL